MANLASRFCNSCLGLFTGSLPPDHYGSSTCTKQTLHATASSFQHAVEAGCHFCSIMYAQLYYPKWAEMATAPLPELGLISYTLVYQDSETKKCVWLKFYLEATLHYKYSNTMAIYQCELHSPHSICMFIDQQRSQLPEGTSLHPSNTSKGSKTVFPETSTSDLQRVRVSHWTT